MNAAPRAAATVTIRAVCGIRAEGCAQDTRRTARVKTTALHFEGLQRRTNESHPLRRDWHGWPGRAARVPARPGCHDGRVGGSTPERTDAPQASRVTPRRLSRFLDRSTRARRIRRVFLRARHL